MLKYQSNQRTNGPVSLTYRPVLDSPVNQLQFSPLFIHQITDATLFAFAQQILRHLSIDL